MRTHLLKLLQWLICLGETLGGSAVSGFSLKICPLTLPSTAGSGLQPFLLCVLMVTFDFSFLLRYLLGFSTLVIYCVAQIVAALALQNSCRWIPLFFWHEPHHIYTYMSIILLLFICFVFLYFCLFLHYLTFWPHKILQGHLVQSLTSPRTSHLSKESWFLLLANSIWKPRPGC